jgi:hypothetical protein
VLRVERGWDERRYEMSCEVECGEMVDVDIYIATLPPPFLDKTLLAAHGRWLT